MYACMDVWMDRQTDGKVDGWVDGQIYGWIKKWNYGSVDRWKEGIGWMDSNDGWIEMDGYVDRQKVMDGWIDW